MNRILFLFFLTVIACTANKKNESGKISLEDIALTDLAGKSIDLSHYKGKTVFINFWATWCRPCLQEMPTIALAQDKFKSETTVFLFASNENLDQITKFKQKQSFEFQYVHLENMEELGIQALPTTFIFDAAGNLKFSEAGYRNWVDEESIQLITNINKAR